jgi:hypothetical protein
MRKTIILFTVFFFPAMGFSATLYVPDDYPTIPQAISAAKDGDTIIVREGIYYSIGNLDGKAITVKSEKGPHLTKIEVFYGDISGRVVSGEGPDTIIDGFLFEMIGWPNMSTGIMIENSAPTIRNCIFDGKGGMSRGILSIASNPTVEGCFFGALYGIDSLGSTVLVRDSVVRWGLGYSINNYSELTLVNSACVEIEQCVYLFMSTATITNSTFMQNGYYDPGCVVYAVDSSATIANSIIWDNWAPPFYKDNSTIDITYSDVEGGYPGTGNIDADPQIVGGHDTHLKITSPCKDAGSNDFVTTLTDYEGDPRIVDETVDMGRDEFHPHLYWRIPSSPVIPHYDPGASATIRFIGYPGTSPVLLAVGSGVLEDPIPTRWGDWWLEFPILGPFNFGSIPSDGVLSFEGTIPSQPTDPYTIPMQALIGSELTNLSLINVGHL